MNTDPSFTWNKLPNLTMKLLKLGAETEELVVNGWILPNPVLVAVEA
jgi:hypothetical protein